jgi:hypothetical protein
LHGASSDQVVAIPITGRPSNTSDVNPWLRIHDRWFIPARPVAANHAALRLLEFCGLLVVMLHMYSHAPMPGRARVSLGTGRRHGRERLP